MRNRTYLVISDGGYKNGLTYGSFRVFDDEGLTIEHKQFTIGIGTNNQAEYISLLNALAWCRDNNLDSVVLFTDSKLVVNQVSGEWGCRDSRMKALCKKTRNMMETVGDVRIQYVPNKFIKQKLGH